MFTRQHYKAIAEIVRDRTFDYHGRDYIFPALLAYDLVDYFIKDNPRFDRDKFLAACGIE